MKITKRKTEAKVKKLTVAMTDLGLTVPQIGHVISIVFEMANGNRFKRYSLQIAEIQNRK